MSMNLSNKPYSSTILSRKRTHLKPSQVAVLQETFVTNMLPDANLRSQLALELGVTERTVQIWFQNRRAKARKLEALSPGSSVPPLVPNVRTGWVDIQSAATQKQSQQYQATFRSCMTPEYFENDFNGNTDNHAIKRRPRSSSKPEKTTSFTIPPPPQRAMSESRVGKDALVSQRMLLNIIQAYSYNQQKPLVSFSVQGIHIGTWARFTRQLNSNNEWDLFCFSNPNSRQLIWQVQDGGHQFRIEVSYDNIKEIRLGQHLQQTGMGQLDIEVKSTSLVSFSMLRNGIDLDWVRCNDFTENQQASNAESTSHILQGLHGVLRQSLLELISQAPELAARLVIIPDNDYLCRDLTASPSATPEPLSSQCFASTTTSATTNGNTSSWIIDDPTNKPNWNSTSFFQQQNQHGQPYNASWAYFSMLQNPNQTTQLLTNTNNTTQNDTILNAFI
ncbi:MAG: hypothetical protein EXX96DRAFT_513903 [Benjaminiella poitrasii]|nr:MAG: hypothetical protein EXX96DRAFT_513903 [Benjaminiella poitrasii]